MAFLVLPRQIHDAADRFVLDGYWLASGLHHRRHPRHLEQVGRSQRMRVRPDFLPMVHGRCHHARVLPRVVLHAVCVLSDLARGVEASEESPNNRTTRGNIRLEIGASE